MGHYGKTFLSEKTISVVCITNDDVFGKQYQGLPFFGILTKSSQWSMKKIVLDMVPLTQMEPPELFKNVKKRFETDKRSATFKYLQNEKNCKLACNPIDFQFFTKQSRYTSWK